MVSNVIQFPRVKVTPPADHAVRQALHGIRSIEEKLQRRPYAGGVKMMNPAKDCELRAGCSSCWTGCAVLASRLTWWENELAVAVAANGMPLKRDGIDA